MNDKYFTLRADLPTLFFNCVVPSDLDELNAGRTIQYEAQRAARHIEDELFKRFSDEYRRQKKMRELGIGE